MLNEKICYEKLAMSIKNNFCEVFFYISLKNNCVARSQRAHIIVTVEKKHIRKYCFRNFFRKGSKVFIMGSREPFL